MNRRIDIKARTAVIAGTMGWTLLSPPLHARLYNIMQYEYNNIYYDIYAVPTARQACAIIVFARAFRYVYYNNRKSLAVPKTYLSKLGS